MPVCPGCATCMLHKIFDQRDILCAKYHKVGDLVRVILCDGTIKNLRPSESNHELSEDGQEMCQYVNEIIQICTNLCSMLTSLQAHCGRGPDLSLFPMVIGRAGKKRKGVEVYDSDDERAYAKEKVPDPKSEDYFNDEVDEFHANRDKIALKKDNVNLLPSGWSSDEEVLGFSSADSDDEEAMIAELKRQKDRQQTKDDMASDVESSDNEDEDLEKGWGRTRSSMYGTDFHKKKIDEYSDSELNDYDLEEESALAIQRRQAQLIDEQEFEEEFAKLAQASESSKSEQTIAADLSKLSKKEKWQIVKKESPELRPLIEKYQNTLKNVRDCMIPLLDCINKNLLDAGENFVKILKEKIHLSLDFCINVSFYFVLKVSREPNIQNHPIIKRLVQFQGLMKRFDAVVGSGFESELKNLLSEMKQQNLYTPETSRVDVVDIMQRDVSQDDRRKRKQNGVSSTKEKRLKRMIESNGMESESNEEESSEDDQSDDAEEAVDELPGDGRRAITNRIMKNRGLTPRRKKENKNPRVKHRMKYRKAKIRRRGQIREVRHEMTPYSGEPSGIRAGVKRGVRLKA